MKVLIAVSLCLCAAPAFAMGKKPVHEPTPTQLVSDTSLSVSCSLSARFGDGSTEDSRDSTTALDLTHELVSQTLVGPTWFNMDESTEFQLVVSGAAQNGQELTLSRIEYQGDDQTLATPDQFQFTNESTSSAKLTQKNGHWFVAPGSLTYAYSVKKIAMKNKYGIITYPTWDVGMTETMQVRCELQ